MTAPTHTHIQIGEREEEEYNEIADHIIPGTSGQHKSQMRYEKKQSNPMKIVLCAMEQSLMYTDIVKVSPVQMEGSDF